MVQCLVSLCGVMLGFIMRCIVWCNVWFQCGVQLYGAIHNCIVQCNCENPKRFVQTNSGASYHKMLLTVLIYMQGNVEIICFEVRQEVIVRF